MAKNRGAKSSTKYKMWMNIKLVPEETQFAVDFVEIEWKHKQESCCHKISITTLRKLKRMK